MKKAILVLVVGSFCRGATLEVPSQYGTIQEAIDTAEAGDEIVVSAGLYEIRTPLTFKGKAITVRSASGPGETIIRMSESPADPRRGSVVIFESGESADSVLEGFALTGGRGTR